MVENIHQKVAEAIQAPGNKLYMGDWHSCNTTHCRAGWMVHLAGEAGYALERETSTAFAAMQIAKASGMPISPSRFYDSDEAAMKDIIEMAEREKVKGEK